jgi:uncharacterized protein with beta-barrel porin domain
VTQKTRFLACAILFGQLFAIPISVSAQCLVDENLSLSCQGDETENSFVIDGTVIETVRPLGKFDTIELRGEITPGAGETGIEDSDGGFIVTGDGLTTTIEIFTDNADGIVALGDGDVFVDGLTIETINDGAGIGKNGTGDLTVTNSNITSQNGDGIIVLDGSDVVVKDSVVTSYDDGIHAAGNGDVLVESSEINASGHAIVAEDEGDVFVTDGSVILSEGIGIYNQKEGNVIVSDSTVGSINRIAIRQVESGDVIVRNSLIYSEDDYGISASDDGDVYVESSTVYSLTDDGINETSDGSVTVIGSFIHSQGDGENHNGIREFGAGDVIVIESEVYAGTGAAINENGEGGVTVIGSRVYGIAGPAIRLLDGGDLIIRDSSVYTESDSVAAIDHVGSGDTLMFDNSRISGAIALTSDGVGNRYKFLAGTVIDGELQFTSTDNSINFGPGYSAALTAGVMPATIVSDNPFVVAGDTVAVVDVTGFATADEVLADTSRTVAGTLEDRLSSIRREGGGTAGFGADLEPEAASPQPPQQVALHAGWWSTGFGMTRDQRQHGVVAAYDHSLAGGLVGYDWTVRPDLIAGVFGGYVQGHAQSADASFQSDMSSWIGGAYFSGASAPDFWNLSLAGGVTGFETYRLVNNNLAVGGLETADADYHGIWFSPSLKFGRDFIALNGMLTPSARIRYAGLLLDDYSESGSLAAMTVDGRSAHVLEARAELAYRFAPVARHDGHWRAGLRAGVEGIFNWGENVEAVLLGMPVVFAAGRDDSVARGYAGADAEFDTAGGFRFKMGIEAGIDTAEALTLSGQIGISLPF